MQAALHDETCASASPPVLDGDFSSADYVQILADRLEKNTQSSTTCAATLLPQQGRAPQVLRPPRPQQSQALPSQPTAGRATPETGRHTVAAVNWRRSQSQGRLPFPPAGGLVPGSRGGSAGATIPLAEAAPPRQSPAVLARCAPLASGPAPHHHPSILLLPRRLHLAGSSSCPVLGPSAGVAQGSWTRGQTSV